MNTELTRREREILEYIKYGWTNQQIADHLFLELGTVKNHVHNIFDKLGVRDRRELQQPAHDEFIYTLYNQ